MTREPCAAATVMAYTKRVPHGSRGALERRSLSNTGLASRSTMSAPGRSTSAPLTAFISSASTGASGSGFQHSTALMPVFGGALGPRELHRAAISASEPCDGGGGLRSSSDTNTTGSGTPDHVARGDGDGEYVVLEHGEGDAREEGEGVEHDDSDALGEDDALTDELDE